MKSQSLSDDYLSLSHRVTILRAGRPGFDSRQGLGLFLWDTASRQALGPTQPPIQCVPRVHFPAIKRQNSEADHSPPYVKVKSVWRYTSNSRILFYVVVLS